MNRRLTRDRDRNSEVRSSRQDTTMYSQTKPPIVQETPEQQYRRSGTMNEQAQTGMGWLERRNQEMNNNSLLPNINDSGSNTNRRRQLGQGFVGGTTKAAGFNRNDFNMTNDFSQN